MFHNQVDFDPSGSSNNSNIEHKGPQSTFHARTVTGPAIYHFGIIDFLQNWTFQKKIERAFKIYVTRKDPDGLSVMPPLQYKSRFQAKLDQIFDLEGNAGGIGAVTVARPPPVPGRAANRKGELLSQSEPQKNSPNKGVEESQHAIEMVDFAEEDSDMVFVAPTLNLQQSIDLGRVKSDVFDDFDDV